MRQLLLAILLLSAVETVQAQDFEMIKAQCETCGDESESTMIDTVTNEDGVMFTASEYYSAKKHKKGLILSAYRFEAHSAILVDRFEQYQADVEGSPIQMQYQNGYLFLSDDTYGFYAFQFKDKKFKLLDHLDGVKPPKGYSTPFYGTGNFRILNDNSIILAVPFGGIYHMRLSETGQLIIYSKFFIPEGVDFALSIVDSRQNIFIHYQNSNSAVWNEKWAVALALDPEKGLIEKHRLQIKEDNYGMSSLANELPTGEIVFKSHTDILNIIRYDEITGIKHLASYGGQPTPGYGESDGSTPVVLPDGTMLVLWGPHPGNGEAKRGLFAIRWDGEKFVEIASYASRPGYGYVQPLVLESGLIFISDYMVLDVLDFDGTQFKLRYTDDIGQDYFESAMSMLPSGEIVGKSKYNQIVMFRDKAKKTKAPHGGTPSIYIKHKAIGS